MLPVLSPVSSDVVHAARLALRLALDQIFDRDAVYQPLVAVRQVAPDVLQHGRTRDDGAALVASTPAGYPFQGIEDVAERQLPWAAGQLVAARRPAHTAH